MCQAPYRCGALRSRADLRGCAGASSGVEGTSDSSESMSESAGNLGCSSSSIVVSGCAGAVGSMSVSMCSSGGEVDSFSGVAVPSSNVTPASPGSRGGNRTSRLMRTWLGLAGFHMRYILSLLFSVDHGSPTVRPAVRLGAP